MRVMMRSGAIRVRERGELRQIEHLHAVIARFRPDVRNNYRDRLFASLIIVVRLFEQFCNDQLWFTFAILLYMQ